MNKTFYIFQNSFFAKDVRISGGDMRLVSIFRRIAPRLSKESCIFVSKDGYKFDITNSVNLNFYISPLIFDYLGIYLCYILRTIWLILRISFKKKREIIFYSSSDFFPDTIVPFLFKNRNNIWVQILHHFYLPPNKRSGNIIKNLIGYISQRFSLFLIKIKTDKVIVVNPLLINELIKLGFEKSKIIPSSNGIDLGFFESLCNEDKAYEASYLGRLTPPKGAFDLIEIWKKVVETKPDAKLLIIGGSVLDVCHKLNKMIDRYQLNRNIFLLGFQEDKIAFRLLKKSKIFLFPSHEEGWGIAIAEAIACRLPVICYDLPVYKRIFDKVIIAVEKYNIDLFVKNILYYLNNEEKCMELVDCAYELIKKYDWSNVAEREWALISS